MKKYQIPEQELAFLKGLQQPFAVYQYVDKRVVTLALSEGFCRFFGYEDYDRAVEDMDSNMYRNVHPDDRKRAADAAVRFTKEGGQFNVIYRTRSGSGPAYRIVHAQGEHVMTPTGERVAHVWYTNEGEYTEESAPEAGVEHGDLNGLLVNALHENSILTSSRYDPLTGLPSMHYFFELAEAGRVDLREEGNPVLLYMDLNGMKFYNYRNGFAAGDSLLRELAELLARTFNCECCCHIGADRFAAFTVEEGLEKTLKAFFAEARKLQGGNSLPVRVGIYPNSVEDVPVSIAYDRAKIACDTVRKTDASGFQVYSRQLRDAVKRRQYIVTNIDRAISEKWIQVYFQPIVRAINGRVCDEEALARWIDPVEGFLSPAEFIPYLEDAGLIYKLDLHVLEQTLELMRRKQEDGLTVVPHSINLSRSDFVYCDIVEEIRKRVDATEIGRDKICIEITESIVGDNMEFMREQIMRFRELGFPVWMDDFGSGYSSLDVLQSIPFDLVKFDMSLLRRLDEGEGMKIILTELMKMATMLNLDTVCEGVETAEQARFLQEIGCSKLQGYFFTKPISYETILERYEKGIQIGFEDPRVSSYYESVGRINLYDLGMIASEDENVYHNAFNTIPMGIIEVLGEEARFVRCNPSYRDFMKRFFGITISEENHQFRKFGAAFMHNLARVCRDQAGSRTFYDDRAPDGTGVRSFARRIAVNPVTGGIAVAVAVLSLTEPDEGESYADIARALASDYYNIYVVDLDTEKFIEYTSEPGSDEMAIERHGKDFFAAARQDTMTRIYEGDREWFLARFTRENVLRELEEHGVYTSAYRLIDSGEPVCAHMKITRLYGGNRIILGVSLVDSRTGEESGMIHR